MRDQLTVFGIDIIKGSVRSRSRRPQYALVRMAGDTVTAEEGVSSFRLFRMLACEQPDILAVDSIQEISTDQRELFSFMQALPPSTRLVQVTGGERKESLVKVASRYNISFNRLDPFEEARTIARVASLGAGAEVIAFENSCDVIVTRHRSPGKGGWSQNRYVRKIHGAVQLRGREIEMDLTAAGIRYEKKETKAFGGSSKVSFRVYAAREKLPVSTYRGADVQVRISGRKLDRITFRPVSARPKYLIVGIDPGTTTAVAALDLEGNLLYLNSSRQTSLSDVTGSLYKVGKPLIVATDVRDMPFSVEKIRRAFNAIGYSPRQDVPVDEKTEYTAPFHYANDHERDALSAALEAYRHYKNKFQHITRRVPPGHDIDDVKAGLIRGLSLEQVLGEIKRTKPRSSLPEIPVMADPKTDERVRVLDGMVKRLRNFVQELQEGVREKDHEIVKLQSRIRKIRSIGQAEVQKDAEVLKRDTVIRSLRKRLHREERSNRNLRKRIERQKKIEEIAISGDSVPVRILPALTKDAIRTLSEDPGISAGDMLYLIRTDGWGSSSIRELRELNVGGVISGPGNPPERDPQLYRACLEQRIPLLNGLDIPVLVRGRIGIAKKDTLDTCLVQWNKAYHDFEVEKNAQQIEDLLKHYQTERGKEMKKIG
jgi:uncharacterized protein